MASTSTLPQEMIDMKRDLQKKIDRAKPVVQQVASGELKVLTDAQKKLVASYDGWVHALEELKAGRTPNPKKAPPVVTPTSDEHNTSLLDSQPLPSDTPSDFQGSDADGSSAQLAHDTSPKVTPSKAPKRRRGARKSVGSAPASPPTSPFDVMMQQARRVEGKARAALIDSYLHREVIDRSKLTALTKEYDSVCQVRRDILAGKITNPTKVQQARIASAEAIKKELTLEQEQIRLRTARERATILAELADGEEEQLAVEEPHATCGPVSEVAEKVEEVPAAEEPAAPTQVAPPEEKLSTREPEPCTPPIVVAEPQVQVPPAAPEEVPPRAQNADVQQSKVTVAPAAASAAPPEEGDMFMMDAMFDAPQEVTPASGKEEKAEAPKETNTAANADDEGEGNPLPPVEQNGNEEGGAEIIAEEPQQLEVEQPKEMDWSAITITKNRRVLHQAAAPDAEPRSPVEQRPISLVIVGQATQEKSSQRSQGKSKKESVPSPTAATTVSAATAARIQKDLEEYMKEASQFPCVRLAPCKDNLLCWHGNVSPKDGPFAGCLIHVALDFPSLYPQEAPVVRAFVDIPHPSIVTHNSVRNMLCMPTTMPVAPREVTSTWGWSPVYSPTAIAAQLQTFFVHDAFEKLAVALKDNFPRRILQARADCIRFHCSECGHTAAVPCPPLPCFNGPFQSTTFDNIFDGAVHAPAKDNHGHRWMHSYTLSGRHAFEVELQGSKGALVGLTEDASSAEWQMGSDGRGWAFDTDTGVLLHNGVESSPLEGIEYPLKKWTVVVVVADFEKQRITFETNGKELASAPIEDVAMKLHPSLFLKTHHSSAQVTLWMSYEAFSASRSSPKAKARAAPSANLPHCFVTKESCDKTALCQAFEVVRARRDDVIPTEMRFAAMGEYLSWKAFDEMGCKMSPTGQRIDAVVPLMLSPAMIPDCIALLKRSITRICRNPLASTGYDPPFRAVNAPIVFALSLNSAVREAMKNKKNVSASLTCYTQLLHSFLLLTQEVPDVLREAQAMYAKPAVTSHDVFALSTLLLDVSWPHVVRRALRAEYLKVAHQLAEEERDCDETLFKTLKSRLVAFEHSAAFAHSVRLTSLPKAVEVFAQSSGHPTEEMAQEVLRRVSEDIPLIASWDQLCAFLDVSTTASDVSAAGQ